MTRGKSQMHGFFPHICEIRTEPTAGAARCYSADARLVPGPERGQAYLRLEPRSSSNSCVCSQPIERGLAIAEHFDHEIYNTTAVFSDTIVPKTLGVIDRHGAVTVLAPYCDARAPSAVQLHRRALRRRR